MLQSKVNQSTREGHDNLYLNNLYKHGYRIGMAISKESHEILSAMYSPMLVIPGTQAPPSGMHELAAAHQRIAETTLAKYVQHHQSFIEIGPNAVSFAKIAIGKTNPHGCTLRSARDQARHAKAAASNFINGYNPSGTQTLGVQSGGVSKRQLHDDVQALASGIPTETFCLNGWQNCDSSAPIAISNHSLYDIGFLDLALGMRNHNCHTIKAFMHFPTEILDVNEWDSYEKGYRFRRVQHNGIRKRDEIHFSWLGDSAFGYIHDYNTWIPYLTKGGFDTPFGFSVLIEKTAWHGSQFELTISRVTAAGRFHYCIPNSLSDLIKVPNIRKIAATGFCKRSFDPSANGMYIVTDGAKVRKLLDFINARAERGFTLDVVKGYARTLVAEIRLGGVLAESRWHCSSSDFSDLCVSIYVLSKYQRTLDALVVRMANDHMDKLGETESAWTKFRHHMEEKYGMKFSHHHPKTADMACADECTRNLFHQISLGFFRDHDSYTQVKEAGWDHEVFFGFNVEDAEPAVEPKLEDIKAAREYDSNAPTTTPAGATTPEWALAFGLPATRTPTMGPVYMAEDQHSILIEECEKNVASLPEEAKSLKTVLATAATELKKRKPDRLFLENMMALIGVPGGAKTGLVINKIIPSCMADGPVLVLCPTGALRDKYSPDLPGESEACTIHTGLRKLDKKKWSLVVIEEAFTLPIAYINFVAAKHRVLLVGDPKQIQHVDFSGLWRGCMMLEALLPCLPTHEITTTKRCPVDVTQLPIIRAAYPNIQSDSTRTSSIKYVGPGFDSPQSTIVCFTQLQKTQLSNVNNRVVFTAHECQGMTFPSVILHFNGTAAEEELIKKSPNHLIVALTRHTTNLFVRDTTEGTLVTYINDTAPANLLADQSNIDLAAIDAHPLPKPVVVEQTVSPGIPYSFTKTEAIAAEAVINKYYPAEAPRENLATTSTALPLGGDAKGKVRLAELGADEAHEQKSHKVHRFPVPGRVMVTKGHNKHFLLRTNLERLTHATRNMDPRSCEILAARLFKNLEEEFNWDLPENFWHQTYLEAVQKMQQRGHDLSDLKPSTDWQENYVCLVKSFLKAQQKPCLGKDPHSANKAGQGISAWDKTLNYLMSPWTRGIEQVLVNQSTGRVRVMSQMTDQEVMAILEGDVRPGDKSIDNDWEKFDSNQNNLAQAIHDKALQRIGCPDVIRQRFLLQQKKRTICTDQSSLEVNDKKDSGGPHTLEDNCLFNTSICLDLMDGFHHLYIKGDDSLALGPDVVFNNENMKFYISKCGYQFKPNASSSGQFVSFIVNTQGVALDLPRIAAKVLSRAYTDAEDFAKYQEAVAGTLLPIRLESGVNMCKVNSLHYTGSTRCEAEFDVLLSFLFRFSRKEIPFSETYESEAIYYRTDGPTASIRKAEPNKIRQSHKKRIVSSIMRAVL
jgi:hypothetical protein